MGIDSNLVQADPANAVETEEKENKSADSDAQTVPTPSQKSEEDGSQSSLNSANAAASISAKKPSSATAKAKTDKAVTPESAPKAANSDKKSDTKKNAGSASSSNTAQPTDSHQDQSLNINLKNLPKGPILGLGDSKPANSVAIKQLDDAHTKIYGRNSSYSVGSYKGAETYNLVIPGGSKLDNSNLSAFKASNLITYIGLAPSSVSWVYDNSGTALDSNHQYNTTWSKTHNSIAAYIKVSYESGFSRVLPVTVGLESDAEQYDQEFFNDVAGFSSHTMYEPNAPLYTGDFDIPSIGNSTLHDGDIPHQYQQSWGYDIDNIIWYSGVTPSKIALYHSIIQDFYAYGRHSNPTYGSNGADWLVHTDSHGDKYAIAYPGINIHYVDGSYSTDIRFSGSPVVSICIYRPILKHSSLSTSVNDFSYFTPDNAKADLDNLANAPGHALFDFGQSYGWVIADPTSNSAYGIKMTGFRKLAASDVSSIGTKTVYIMVRYTKSNGDQDGYYLLPVQLSIDAGIHATGSSKVFDDSGETKDDIIALLNSTGSDRIKLMNQDNAVLDVSGLTASDFDWLDNTKAAMTTDPLYAGTYYLHLNSAGLTRLESDNPGKGIGSGTNTDIEFVISKAPAKAVLSGSNQKTFDNQAFQNADLYTSGSTIAITFTFPGYTSGTYTLQDGDYDWYTKEGSIYTAFSNMSGGTDLGPVAVGTYYLKLSAQGQENIKQWVKSTFGEQLADSLDWSEGFGAADYARFVIKPAPARPDIPDNSGPKPDLPPANPLPSDEPSDLPNKGTAPAQTTPSQVSKPASKKDFVPSPVKAPKAPAASGKASKKNNQPKKNKQAALPETEKKARQKQRHLSAASPEVLNKRFNHREQSSREAAAPEVKANQASRIHKQGHLPETAGNEQQDLILTMLGLLITILSGLLDFNRSKVHK